MALATPFICSICCFVHKVKTRRREGIRVISFIRKLPKGSRLNFVRHLLVTIRKIQFSAGVGIFFCFAITHSPVLKLRIYIEWITMAFSAFVNRPEPEADYP